MRKTAASNPAQRLLDILRNHERAVQTNGAQGYDAVWMEATGVDREDVTATVAATFGLIHDIEAALALTQDEHMAQSFRRYRDEWAKAFVPNGSGRSHGVKDSPSPDSLLALGGIASHLSSDMPEGRVPDPDEAMALHDEVADLIECAREDESIPENIRLVIVGRLHDMAWALDHIEIGGAGQIQAALDRLMLAYACFLPKEDTAGDPGEDGQGEDESVAAGIVDAEVVDDEARRESFSWDRVRDIMIKVNDLISAPGAWASTAQLMLIAAPHIEQAMRSISP